ncbi:MAG: RNA polymerase sigma factor [Nannocystaceae bacterium]|nr:sigma-70 family RNA polymerase sigma factor [bacterium]
MSDQRTDRELLDAWAAGEKPAGAALFDRHFGALSRFFHNKAGDAADDLIQRSLLACLEARERFEGKSSFRTFLFSIARNVLFDHYRARHRGPQAPDFGVSSIAEMAPSASSLIAAAGRQRSLLEALRSVPLQFQIVLELAYWERLTAAEIGEIVGAPEGTVRTRLRRAKELVGREMRRIEKLGIPLESTVAQLDDWAAEVRKGLA